MSNIKIAFRLRPLSERERSKVGSFESVIEVEDPKTVAVTNLKVPRGNAGDSRERIKRFLFDFCFDSSSDQNYNYATQTKVYEKLGGLVLESLDTGQDVCVLAYGQSASGKTYTMMGSPEDPGLTPRLCRDVMKRCEGQEKGVIVSYFEIYNERVRDLLHGEDLVGNDVRKNTSAPCVKELRVREHPRNGPYVEALNGIAVHDNEQLWNLVSLGSSRRRTAETSTNPSSSRSHAVLALKIDEPSCTLTLLDLAGSERPCRVNQSLPRQKEGANINRSLVALSNVISALALSTSRLRRYVPYRDSVLTWLLKDTLAGNGTTIMIATASPSKSCYAESVNTMRWAARARRIPPGVRGSLGSRGHDGNHERALRSLRAEIARLRALIRSVNPSYLSTIDDSSKSQEKEEKTNPDRSIKDDPIVEEDKENNNSESSQIASESETVREDNKDHHYTEESDSLNSSKLSLASSSGNASIPSTQGSIPTASRTEDVVFGPRLHRTGSEHDVKPLPPLRNKKRQYSSHEVLPTSKPPLKPQVGQTDPKSANKKPVIYREFNKRAEIVASVTDRLYSKVKKKIDNKLTKKMDTTPENENNYQTLNELTICTNARKKLFDISHRALRASRRLRIGVPVETQTEKPSVVRVKEAAVDVQRDIEPFVVKTIDKNISCKNVSVETENTALRCKEASVGRIKGSVFSKDQCVETEKQQPFKNLTITRSCGNMTDDLTASYDSSTQTCETLEKPKKQFSFTKYLRIKRDVKTREDPDNEGISDDSLECEVSNNKKGIASTPDLLNYKSHKEIDNGSSASPDSGHFGSLTIKEPADEKLVHMYAAANNIIGNLITVTERDDSGAEVDHNYDETYEVSHRKSSPVDSDFDVDDNCVTLPRICVSSDCHGETMKELILGRNGDIYPYNIRVSPIRFDSSKKKSSKSVSWKPDHVEDCPTRVHSSPCIKSIMKKKPKPLRTCHLEPCSHIHQSDCPNAHYKGVRCWDDRTPSPSPNPDDNESIEKCIKYMEATSSFLTEATDLVTKLSKVSDMNLKSTSPRCSSTELQNDERRDRLPKSRGEFCSLMINDTLIRKEDAYESDSYRKTKILDYAPSDELVKSEKELLDSLDRLESRTSSARDYFGSVRNIYYDKFDSELATSSLPPVLVSPKPYPRSRRSPSKYLQELIDIRRELVKSTERDEIIYKTFHFV